MCMPPTEHTLKAWGTVGKSFSVLTDWRLGDILTLNGAAIVPGTKVPEKVTPDVISIALPPISGEEWVGALAVAGQNHQQPASLKLPEILIFPPRMRILPDSAGIR